jgi:multiple sugar transport system ATP-binding protein
MDNVTMVYVTHDQVEAMTLADRICVLRDGLVEQVGTPMELYEHPNSVFVAGFIGSPKMNFISGEKARAFNADTVGIRGEHINIVPGNGTWTGTVIHTENLGADSYVYLEMGTEEPVVVRLDGANNYKSGDTVHIAPMPDKIHRFDAAGKPIR